jgi:D-lactate dehydrogenase (cytochrome)
MPRIAMEFVPRHIPGTRDPFLAPHPWYVLIETSAGNADGTAERLLVATFEAAAGVIGDTALARSLAQAQAFWRLRQPFSAAQKGEGGNIKNDVAVPVEARPLAVGHFGDGNVHYNIAQPPGVARAEFLARWDEVVATIDDIVLAFDGSISAEHGIGQLKRAELARSKPEARPRTVAHDSNARSIPRASSIRESSCSDRQIPDAAAALLARNFGATRGRARPSVPCDRSAIRLPAPAIPD